LPFNRRLKTQQQVAFYIKKAAMLIISIAAFFYSF